MSLELAVIIPTLNEVNNIRLLVHKLDQALADIDWEVVFVNDDSSDGTIDTLRALALERPNVRYLHRIGRRGLASACVEGMLSTPAPVLAVMDADLQHDERLLRAMFERLRSGPLDAVVASRFLEDSSLGAFPRARERLSRWGVRMSRWLTGTQLSDPMSGFFMLRREVLHDVVRSLTGQGFKILLDIFASANRPLAFAEVPFIFRERHSGASKLNSAVMLEFVSMLIDKALGDYVPVRFIKFVLVGLFGMVVHVGLLWVGFKLAGLNFLLAQAMATLSAMIVNFHFNNQLTYRDRRLKGSEFYVGLLSFCLACSIGAVINFQVARAIFELDAGWMLSGLLGAVVGSVWNFGITSTFTWNPKGFFTRRTRSAAAPLPRPSPSGLAPPTGLASPKVQP